MSHELVLDSLRRRMRALHSLYYDAVATMDLDQVNHFEREGVLPIAFSLFHIVNMMDASFMLMTGVPPIWDAEWERGWARPSPTMASTARSLKWSTSGSATTTVPAVHGRGVHPDRAVAGPPGPAELTRVVVGRPLPPQVATTYSARVAGPAGVTLLDAAECWIYQHGLRHMGEIELARGMVGLGGMTS